MHDDAGKPNIAGGDSREQDSWSGKTVYDLIDELQRTKKTRAAKRVKESAASAWGSSATPLRKSLTRHPAFPFFCLFVALAGLVVVYYSRHQALEDFEAALITAFLAVQAAALVMVSEATENRAATSYRIAVSVIPACLGAGLFFISSGTEGAHGLRVGAVYFVLACAVGLILDVTSRVRRTPGVAWVSRLVFGATGVVVLLVVYFLV